MILQAVLGFLLTQQPAPQTGIVYRTVAGQELKLDFYPPVTASAEPAPLVVAFHGGAWISGTREQMAQFCIEASKRGMAAATVSYRLGPRSKWPAMIEDARAAVRFFRDRATEYRIDPNRIGAAGASAGGHLALLLGTQDVPEGPAKTSSRVQAVLNMFGPTDLSADYNPGLSALVALQVLGKPLDQAGDVIKEFSPVNHVDAKSAPIFTIHGKADVVVPFRQAERLDEAARKAGIPHTFIAIENMGHEMPLERPEVLKALQDGFTFLTTTLASPADK
ncbi:MAG: alpha/beta hydrolase [Fimbriimonadaceae bacterium]|nr:alpha/beta hydrolase [Fimbriimonadaceae bacterium]